MKRFLAAFLLIASPAFALSGGDIIGKLSPKEQAAFVTGAVEMAMLADPDRAECILNWYFAKDAQGNAPRGPQEVIASFERYADKPATGIIRALINRACPE